MAAGELELGVGQAGERRHLGPAPPVQRGEDGALEAGQGHRLGQHPRRPERQRPLQRLGVVTDRHQDAARGAREAQPGDLAIGQRGLHAPGAGIEQHDLEGVPGRVGGLQPGGRLGLRGTHIHPRLQAAEHRPEGHPRRIQVVHHQHPQAGQQAVGPGCRRAAGQTHPEPEVAALAEGAVGPRLTAHQARQMGGDGEPQPGAAETPGGGGVGLLEGPEQPAQRLGLDADAGVDDLEAQVHLGLVLGIDAGAQLHHAGIGELDRVAEVVEQHLAEAGRVAAQHVRHVGDIDDHLDPLLGGPVGDQRADLADHLLEVEIGLVEGQAAGLDLRDVEDVVDDREQVLGRVAHLDQAGLGLDVRDAAAQQVGEPDDRVHRRADLVAHVGEEDALGAVGRIGGLAGRLELDRALRQHPVGVFQLAGALGHPLLELVPVAGQLGLGALALGDVLLDAQVVGDAPVGLDHRRDARVLHHHAAIAAPVVELALPGLPGAQGRPQGDVGFRRRLAGTQETRLLAQHVGHRVARALGEGLVDVLDGAGGVGDDHARPALVEGLGELVQLGVGGVLGGVVTPHPGHVAAAADLHRAVAQLDLAGAAVGVAIPALEGRQALAPLERLESGLGLFSDLRALDVAQGQPGKLVAGIAQARAGRVVEFGEVQRLEVEQHDAVRRLVDDGAVDLLPRPQGLLVAAQRRDVAQDAEHPGRPPVGTEQGAAGGQHETPPGGGVEDLLAGDLGAAIDHLLLGPAGPRARFRREQRLVGVAQHVGAGQAMEFAIRAVQEGVSPLRVLGVHQVPRALGDHVEQLQLAQLAALDRLPLQAQHQGPPLGEPRRGADGREQREGRRRGDPQHPRAGSLIHLGLVHLGHQQPVGAGHLAPHAQHRRPPVVVGRQGAAAAERLLGDDHAQRVAPGQGHPPLGEHVVAQRRDELQRVTVAPEQLGLGGRARHGPVLHILEQLPLGIDLQDDHQREPGDAGAHGGDEIEVIHRAPGPRVTVKGGLDRPGLPRGPAHGLLERRRHDEIPAAAQHHPRVGVQHGYPPVAVRAAHPFEKRREPGPDPRLLAARHLLGAQHDVGAGRRRQRIGPSFVEPAVDLPDLQVGDGLEAAALLGDVLVERHHHPRRAEGHHAQGQAGERQPHRAQPARGLALAGLIAGTGAQQAPQQQRGHDHEGPALQGAGQQHGLGVAQQQGDQTVGEQHPPGGEQRVDQRDPGGR